MIIKFDIPLVKQSVQRQRRSPLESMSFDTPIITSIYVPVMDASGFEFAHEDDYMWIFKENDTSVPTITKGRTVQHNLDGIVYTTTDGTDARKRLKYELVVSNALESGGDMERGNVLFELSKAEPML